MIETLSTRFNSRVELDDLQVSLIKGLAVSGKGLRIYNPDDVVAAGAKDPLFVVRQFEFHARLMGLFLKPTHVGTVYVQGLEINIPPKSMRQQNAAKSRHQGKIKIVVDELVCDDSRLVIGTDKPNKDPKIFVLSHIVLHHVGPNAPLRYDATLTNAMPKGQIHAVGTFGPWDTETPGDSTVTGKYTFQHADLNPIKGIGGILHSVGDFTGQLDRIEVHGTADVPDFSLDTANHPVPLHTQFSAIVDGTTGDTYLQPVQRETGRVRVFLSGRGSECERARPQHRSGCRCSRWPHTGLSATCRQDAAGGNDRGPDHENQAAHPSWQGERNPEAGAERKLHAQAYALYQSASAGQGGHAEPAGARPSKGSQARSRGRELSHDGKIPDGRRKAESAGSELRHAWSNGRLAGVYTLDGKKFDFTGKVRTDAKLSQMVASRWKSWGLKVVDPFFHKHGAGAEIPVKITGTNTAPKFGLDLFHKDKQPQ